MMDKDFITNLLDLYRNPLFGQQFLEFSVNMQQMGIQAAKQFWQVNRGTDSLPFNAPELFEQMAGFYSQLGFVPKQQHDKVLEENEQLRQENQLLKDTLRQLNLKMCTEANLQVQEMWKEIAYKQMDMGTEIAKTLMDLFKQDGDK